MNTRSLLLPAAAWLLLAACTPAARRAGLPDPSGRRLPAASVDLDVLNDARGRATP